jgi:hypothetical protein
VTAKTGWITLHAHGDSRCRPQLQIMACKLALGIVAAIYHDT